MLIQSINLAKAHDLYGRVEAGQLLRLPVLGNTLMAIANITEEGILTRN